MLVDVAHGLVGLRCLGDAAEGLIGVPFVDGELGAGPPFGCLAEIQLTEEPVGVGGVGDHGGAVGAGAGGYDDVGAGLSLLYRRDRRYGARKHKHESFHTCEDSQII